MSRSDDGADEGERGHDVRGADHERNSDDRLAEPAGAFYAYPNISVAFGKPGIGNTLQFAERALNDAKVAVVPGEAFGTDHHIRISYATSLGELERGLERLHKFITE